MAKWTETNAPKTGGGGDIPRLDWKNLAADGKPWRIRLVGDLLPNYIYWLENKEGGKRTRNVTNFNRSTEEFDNSVDDPIARLVKPRNPKIEPQFAYVTKVINREDGKEYILELKATVYKSIVQFAQDPDWGDPTHPEKGYDFKVEKKRTGPLPQNVKYVLTPSRLTTPLSDEEKAMLKSSSIDLAKLYKQETPEEQIQWLRENTNYLNIDIGNIPSNSQVQDTPEDDVPY